MAKTKPIGVRFDQELLDAVKEKGYADSPQKALNLYEIWYKRMASGAVDIPKKKELPPQVAALSKPIVEIHTAVPTEQLEQRIKQIESELRSPPKSAAVGMKMWFAVREVELKELKKELLSRTQ